NKYRQTLGETYYRSQIYYNALIEFQTILQNDPKNAIANFMLGVTIYKQAVLEELVEAFLDLLDEGTNGQAQQEKKFSKKTGIDPIKKRKVYEDMVDAFTKASKARKKFMQATFNLALTYMEMGDLNNAERYFKATILIKPTLVRAHSKLAEVYEEQGKLHIAIEQYKKVFYLKPGIFVNKPTLGEKHQYRNVLNIFMHDLETKIKRNPNDAKSNIVLAKVFRAQGFNGKAANVLRSILTKNPRNKDAKILLARIEKGKR
ncbi:MAG: tetratricopeptide repeat protein, partial [Candidatus Heimdallarchaeota archaeon]|nr:tetratricopeptide repeat protein [Candidatus Heimdallarchaeota archaeon]